MATTTTGKPPRRLGLPTQVFIGLGLGILVGIFFGEEAAFLKIGGDIFIALLQVTVIPYVVVALITSLGRLTLDDAKALGLRAGGVLLVLWAIGIVVVLASPLAFPDWPSGAFFSASQIEPPQPVDFIQLYIPANIFASLSNAVVPAIVVFGILFGVALINVATKARILDLLTTASDALLAINGFIGRLAPYGVFAITASASGTIDVGDLGRLQVYIAVYVVIALIMSFWLLPGLIAATTPLRYGDIMRTFRGPLITAFATGNVLIVLPILAADGKEILARAEDATTDPKARRIERSSIDILIPAAYPFPNLGGILALMFVLFGGWYVGSAVELSAYPTLVFAGLASLFGGTVLALPFLFDLLRLPADLFQVFITVDVIGSRFGTLLAAMHIIAIALIGTYALQGAITLRFVPLLRFALVTVILLGVSLAGIRAVYTYVYVAPYRTADLLESLQLTEPPQPHTVYREPPSDGDTAGSASESLERILARGTLKVCYAQDDYPSAFLNAKGELVGFDVAMAHRLASSMNLAIEFVPINSIADIERRVSTGYCDVAMSLVPISPDLTRAVSLTESVLEVALAMIVSDHRRNEFATWAEIAEIDGLHVAISDSFVGRNWLARELPNATATVFRSKADLDSMLAAGAPGVDAVLAAGEEGAAWTIRYPKFNLVVPTPVRLLPFGYAVDRRDHELLLYLDTWLVNAKIDGTIDQLYRYWMLGEVKESQPPRWSVIRNVLGWID